jgi:FtsP/CotA-like multicopper oxidase with cupredoxin domain
MTGILAGLNLSIFRSSCFYFVLLTTSALMCSSSALPQSVASEPCSAGSPAGASIDSPKELVSRNGRLQVSLRLRNYLDSSRRMHYCYIDGNGDRSPTLRLRPGDLLILKLKNELQGELKAELPLPSMTEHPHKAVQADCKSAAMTMDGTNLHFHGLGISPSCHSDDSLHVSVAPSQTFEYRVRIPRNQPPGLYWYHPHPHGHSEEQVLGGASGALIVEGMAAANPVVAGLPERVLVIRDEKLRNQNVEPPSTGASDHDPSRPAKDLSINFVPVPYPEYPVATINTRPLTREFWRVLNASADTYVNLGVLLNGEWRGTGLVTEHGNWQPLSMIAVDGVPISEAKSSNSPERTTLSKTDILIPPGGRAEFILQTPPLGVSAELITVGADTTSPADEDNDAVGAPNPETIPDNDDNTPPRPLARIVSSRSAVEPPTLKAEASIAGQHPSKTLAALSPVRQRKLYFSEKAMDPKHPETSTVFYLTEEGHTPKAFDPLAMAPDIVVHQGDVEDWTIENRSLESHVFHIHQIHFLLLARDGDRPSEQYLLDTVDVPYWDGSSAEFPSVKLRMDFRDLNIVGTFPYHCHILQHVDGGMMGLIEVLPKPRKRATKSAVSP